MISPLASILCMPAASHPPSNKEKDVPVTQQMIPWGDLRASDDTVVASVQLLLCPVSRTFPLVQNSPVTSNRILRRFWSAFWTR